MVLRLFMLTVIGCCCCILPAFGQSPRYASHGLQQLAVALEAACHRACGQAQTFRWGENRVSVTTDSLGRIDHIGWEIFPERIRQENPSPVYRFVERYLLELYLQRELPTPRQRLREDKVTLLFPGHEDEPLTTNIERRLPRFDAETSLLVLTDNNCYSVSVYRQGKQEFFMRFPIRYELLWGMNKKEAEGNFYPDLLLFQAPAPSPCQPLTAEEAATLKPEAEGCYQLPGDIYWIEAMNSTLTYVRTAEGEYRPVCDSRLPEASARNLFLLSCGKEVNASVKQRLYNRRTLEFETSLHRLLSFCRAEGCRPYVGIETVSQTEVTGTVVLHNPSYGYCHQLFFRLPLSLLSTPANGLLQLELYAYVPTHNIENLFFERKPLSSPITNY